MLRENKVEYGIFLTPQMGRPDGAELATRLTTLNTQTKTGMRLINHFALSDAAPTPLAVSIETKSSATDTMKGNVQLANWVRAHYRQLAVVAGLKAQQCTGTHGEHGGATLIPSLLVPMLPLVFVSGTIWRVDFALRRDNKTIIYTGPNVGNTHTLDGCYRACAAIRRLAEWAQEDYMAWWMEILS